MDWEGIVGKRLGDGDLTRQASNQADRSDRRERLRALPYVCLCFIPFLLFICFLIPILNRLTICSDVGYEEKRESLIRRVDFAWAVEKDDNEKEKKKKKTSKESTPWPWQTLVENLQLAQQELTVIIDLINTVSFISFLVLRIQL